MFCTQCGKENPANSRFCMHCGSKFVTAENAEGLTASPEVVKWEYQDFVLDYSDTGLGCRLADPLMISTARLEIWASVRATVMEQMQKWLDQGWQPVASIGPDCLEFKEIQRNELFGGMGLFGTNTYEYLQAVRIQMRRRVTTRTTSSHPGEVPYLSSAAKSQVTQATIEQALALLTTPNSANTSGADQQTLQYFMLIKEISEYFQRWILGGNLQFDKARVEQGLSAFKVGGLQELLKFYQPLSEEQKNQLCFHYLGLRKWLEDDLLATLLYAAKVLKIRLGKDDLLWLARGMADIQNSTERIDRIVNLVVEREKSSSQRIEALKKLRR